MKKFILLLNNKIDYVIIILKIMKKVELDKDLEIILNLFYIKIKEERW